MSDEKFDLVFKGQLAKSVELDTAVRNLAQLFKIDQAKAKALFSGKATILKRNMDMDTANKYRVALKKAGAIVELKAVATPATAKAEVPASRDNGRPPLPVVEETESLTTSAGVFGDPRPAPNEIPVPDFGIAPEGEDLLREEEKIPVEADLAIDVSALSLKEGDGNLLNEDEYQEFVPLPVNESAFEVAPAGADVLKPEERKKEVVANVDISALSLGEPGQNLAPPKPAAPPPPDTSKISLAD